MPTELPSVRPAEGWCRYFAKQNRARVAQLRVEMRGLAGDALIDTIGFAAWHTGEAKRLDILAAKEMNQ